LIHSDQYGARSRRHTWSVLIVGTKAGMVGLLWLHRGGVALLQRTSG
jgi:hypothetical protein